MSSLTAVQQRDRVPNLFARGHDTMSIATLTGLTEAEVCRILHAERERRRAAR